MRFIYSLYNIVTAGASALTSQFFLIVNGDEYKSLPSFEPHLKNCGCIVSGQKILLDEVIVTKSDVTSDTVGKVLESSNIESKPICEEEMPTSKLKLFNQALQQDEPSDTKTDEEGEDILEQSTKSILSLSLKENSEQNVDHNIVLTGLTKNKLIEMKLRLRKKKIHVFQVPHSGSKDCLQWDATECDEKSLLNCSIDYYSFFQANVYLISTGKSPLDHPSAEVLSGIIIANAERDDRQKCAIVLTNSRGLCRRKLGPLEEKYEAAKLDCQHLTEKRNQQQLELPKLQQKLQENVNLSAVVQTTGRFEAVQKDMQETMEKFLTKKKECLLTEKEIKEKLKTVKGLESWQDVVTIYHTDDLFSSSATTVIITDQSQQHENPQEYLDMSTLVEWSPQGYLTKLKQHIAINGIAPHRKVHAYADGSDITNTIFKAKEIHLFETYSVETPWNTDDWTKTEVYVVKETLHKKNVLYLELDPSSKSKGYYKIYFYKASVLWKREYITRPQSSEERKIQLVDIAQTCNN